MYIHIYIALEPIGKELQIVNVSKGGSTSLPCMKGVFPRPSNISWWRNDNKCDSLQCLVSNSLISYDRI